MLVNSDKLMQRIAQKEKPVMQMMERLQEDMHSHISQMIKETPALKYQDCVTTYLLYRIASIIVQNNIKL